MGAATKHVVQFSTGVSSAEVAFRLVERYGAEHVVLLTADTLVEDEDNWRFAREVVSQLGDVEWTVLADGRTPMEVGRDEKVVPNNQMAVCSKVLKRRLLRRHITATFDPATTVMHLGYGRDEEHRIAKSRPLWEPWTIDCPLTWEGLPVFLLPGAVERYMRDVRGFTIPRLYDAGFEHANCGGACVRGGQVEWRRLLHWNRDRYLWWEAEEEKNRAVAGDYAVLKDRRGGETVPLTLHTFRERQERDPTLFDINDTGACGCRMDEESA